MPSPRELGQKLAAQQAAKLKQEEQERELRESEESPDSEVDVEPAQAASAPGLTQEITPESVLSQLPNGPSTEQIQSWREKFSSVYVLPLREDDWYVWRYLELREWRKIQSQLKTIMPDNVEEFIQNQVLGACVIWPKEKIIVPENSDRSPAGLRDLLYEVIMAGSYFMSPDQALARAVKL